MHMYECSSLSTSALIESGFRALGFELDGHDKQDPKDEGKISGKAANQLLSLMG